MPEGAYSAGTIFLQVVPVFGDTMNKIARNARDMNKAMGDEAEKGGKDAGERAGKAFGENMSKEVTKSAKKDGEAYGGLFQKQFTDAMRKAHREIEPVQLNLQSNKARSEIATLKRELKTFSDTKVNVHLTAKEAHEAAARILAQIEAIKAAAKKVDLKVNFDEGTKGLNQFLARVEAAHPTLKVDVDTKIADRAMGAFEQRAKRALKQASQAFGDNLNPQIQKIKAKLDALSDAEIGIDLDAAAFHSQVAALEAEIEAVPNIDVGVDIDLLAARAALAGYLKEVRKADREDISNHVELSGVARAIAQLRAYRREKQKAARAANDSATAFRAFNFVILAVAAAIPGVIPLIAALGGALLALAPILAGVGAGAGVAILGFTGIGNAVKALGNVQKNGKKDAVAHGKAMRSAARGVEDAERSLSRARKDAAQANADASRNAADAAQNAARANKDAARAVADAERSAAEGVRSALQQRANAERGLASAQRDAAAAQRDLRQARRDAQQDIENLNNNVAQNGLDERQGVIDVFNATVANQQTQQDGSASNLEKEQADLALQQARLRLKEIRQEQKRLAAEKKRVDRDGVNGTDRVIAAQEALTQAIQRQRDAQREVGEAARAVDQARVDGARQVADAIANQRRTEAEGARSVADAHEQQRRTQVDGAQSVQDAQRNLIQAQEDYQTALKQTGEIGSSSQAELRDAMNKLGPAGQKFARYIFSLRKGFYAIRDAAQQAMLPGVQAAMETVINKYGPRFENFVSRMGKAVGDSFRMTGRAMVSPVFEDFFKMINRLGPKFTRNFSKTTLNWMGVFARLMTIAAPWAEKLSDALLRVSDNALKFVKSKKGTDQFVKFLRFTEKIGPVVWDFLKNIVKAAINLGHAMMPLGMLVLRAFDGLMKLIANMDPKVLGLIATGILSLVIIFQTLQGVIALSAAGSKLLVAVMASIPLLILAIVLVVTAIFITLYTQVPAFRKVVDVALHAIGEAIKWLWKNIIKPYFTLIVGLWRVVFKVIKWAWQNIIQPVFKALGKAVEFLWKFVFKPYLTFMWGYIRFLGKVLKFVWDNILSPVLDLLGKAMWKLWKGIFKVAIDGIVWAWKHILGPIVKAVWQTTIKPVFDNMKTGIGLLRKAFKTAVDAIGDIWSGLKKKMKTPINWVIRYVFNEGIIKAFNKVADFVGSKQMKYINYVGGGNSNSSSSATGLNASPNNPKFATGGVLPGFTPGRDPHKFYSPTGGGLELSGGEAIMRPEWTRAVGKNFVHRMNDIAARYGSAGVAKLFQGRQAFAAGGIWHPGRRSPDKADTFDRAWDINSPGGTGTPVRAFLDGKVARAIHQLVSYGNYAILNHPGAHLSTLYAHLSKLFVHAGQSVKRGQVIGLEGSVGNSSGPHLHFEIGGSGNYSMGGGGGGIGGVLGKFLGKIVGNPAKWLLGKVTDKLGDLTGKFGDNRWVGLATSLVKKLAHGVGDKIGDMIGGFGGNDVSGGHIGAGAKAVREAVKRVAAAYGWDSGAQWSALDRLINGESGWNPNARNPNSSASGLFQKMTSLHGALEGTVAGQARWGLNYIKGAYGSPARAWSKWNSRNPHWYADGGIIGDQGPGTEAASVPDNGTMLYDNGGYLRPGLTTVVNLTGKPEPVFTNEQFRNLGGGSGDGGPTYHYEPTFVGSDLTADDVADDMLYGFRKLHNTGKYGRP